MPNLGQAWQTDSVAVRWRLGAYLRAHEVSVYRLHRELRGELSRTALYNIARGETRGLDFDTLASLIAALRRLTGEEVAPNDLIEVAVDVEDDGWG